MHFLLRIAAFFLVLSFSISSGAATGIAQSETGESTLSVRTLALEIGSIPRGAQRVRFLSLHFINSCDRAISIREIRVHHYGLGDASDFTGVYLLHGVERLTRSARISSADQIVTLRPKSLILKACGQVQLDIAADFQRDASIGSEHQFEVLAEADIVTDAESISGKFPLRMVSRASISPLDEGGITVTFLPLSSSTSAIAEHTLAKIQLSADNVSSHLISSITLTNKGTAKNAEIRSLYITTAQEGNPLTNTALALQGDEVTLRFLEPYFLKSGDTQTLHLKGRRYTRRKTVDFVLREPSDLDATRVAGTRRY